jgi:hypothetical protein
LVGTEILINEVGGYMSLKQQVFFAQDAGAGAARTNNLSHVQTMSENGRWDEYSRERDLTIDIVQAVDLTLN